MKGKNKEQHQSNSQALAGKQDVTNLSFPDVTPLDHLKMCPRYTSILNRPDGDGVGIEEMDNLQMEIESLLVNVMQRNRLLKIETMILDNDKNSDSVLIPQTSSLNKSQSLPVHHSASSSSILFTTPKEKSTPSTLSKKNKSFTGKPGLAASSSANSLLKSNSLFQNEQSSPVVRNEIPDIFWQSVEPYCADLTEDDLKYLTHQIELCDKYSNSFVKIGPLGKHYTLQWAEEDLNHQIKEGSRFQDLDSKTTPSGATKRKASVSGDPTPTNYFLKKQSLIEESLEKLSKNQQSENVTYGPLTQRLISALIEQNLMTPFDNEINDYLDKMGPPQSSYLSPRTMAKKFTFNTNNSSNIEKKIKKTLIEQGILPMDENEKMDFMSGDENSQQSLADGSGSVASDQVTFSKDDEIANEILNVQNELKLVSKQCKQSLEQLFSIAKHNMTKQEIKKKISVVDMEIIEFFDKFKTSRLAKKPILKKDKEKAQRLIKEREVLQVQLNEIK